MSETKGTTILRRFSNNVEVSNEIFIGNADEILFALDRVSSSFFNAQSFCSISHVECWWKPDNQNGFVYEFVRQWRLDID